MKHFTRRHFLGLAGLGLGGIALSALLRRDLFSPAPPPIAPGSSFGKAKRVIYLFQSGGPSQLDLFDDKPTLRSQNGLPMPENLTRGQRVAQLQGQSLFVCGSKYQFAKHGQSGAELSELLPHTAKIVDDITIIKSMQTDSINHDPGITFMQTGSEQTGRPSMGAWVSYGLGTLNENLPAFVVLISNGKKGGQQPLFSRLWSNGFLPGMHQGVQLRAGRDPVLYLSNPDGVSREARRDQLDCVQCLDKMRLDEMGDPEIQTHIEACEMAFRMQTSMPELTDLRDEPAEVFDLYGADPNGAPTFANNCLIARRLAERGVRFIQLYHRDWDHHNNLPPLLEEKCKETDQASAALILDLKRRGLLDDTLVIWGGEFGRSPMRQGSNVENYGRDHHNRAFAVWLAGGGIKAGQTIGTTDEYGYQAVEDPIHVHDLHATLLHCLGVEHEKLTFRHQGRDFRLTDVAGRVVKRMLA